MNLVTRLFAEFDDCTARFGVYKVCTIGDAYVAVNEPRVQLRQGEKFSGCVKVMQLARTMLEVIIRVRQQVQHEDLDMRIGLHHGGFVAGVIGTNRLRFDMWGEDVLIGNTIESNGLPGKVCVSEEAMEVLEEAVPRQYAFTFHKEVQLKTKRAVKSYLCSRGDEGENWSRSISGGMPPA